MFEPPSPQDTMQGGHSGGSQVVLTGAWRVRHLGYDLSCCPALSQMQFLHYEGRGILLASEPPASQQLSLTLALCMGD